MLIPISKHQNLLYRNNTFIKNKFLLNLIILNKVNLSLFDSLVCRSSNQTKYDVCKHQLRIISL
jgi:hypothetical protein